MANPYAAPIADHQRAPTTVGLPGDGQVTPAILDSMRQTRPWVLFLGILGFIGAGFMVLGGLGMLVAGSAIGGGEMGAIAIVYIVMAVFYIFPSLYLYRYASSIKMLMSGYGVHALEEALSHQKSFWKLVGICTAVMMVLYFVGFIVLMAVGAAGAMSAL
jgi:hypothetical protein